MKKTLLFSVLVIGLLFSCKKEKLPIPTENAVDVAAWYATNLELMDNYFILQHGTNVARDTFLAPSLENGQVVLREYKNDPTGTIPIALTNVYIMRLDNPRNTTFPAFDLYDQKTGQKINSEKGEFTWYNETIEWGNEEGNKKWVNMTHYAMSDHDLSKFNPATPSPVSFNGTSWITEIVSQRSEGGIFYVTYRNSVTGDVHKVEIKPEKFWPEKYSYFVGKVDGVDARVVLSTSMDYCGGSSGLAIKFYWDETTAPNKH